MANLNTYANSLFMTHFDMETALAQAATIANGSDNAAAVHTAVHVVLNTAIRMHKEELSAANKPLLELIDARVADAVNELRDDIGNQIEQAVDDYDHASVIRSWLEDNLDPEDLLSGRSFTISFD